MMKSVINIGRLPLLVLLYFGASQCKKSDKPNEIQTFRVYYKSMDSAAMTYRGDMVLYADSTFRQYLNNGGDNRFYSGHWNNGGTEEGDTIIITLRYLDNKPIEYKQEMLVVKQGYLFSVRGL